MEKNNFKKEDAGCDRYGTQRLEQKLCFLLYLKNNVLTNINKPYFIENGTLLGAWRNGKFIPHDDDFDFAMLIDSEDEINEKLLNSKYKARIIDTYSSKI